MFVIQVRAALGGLKLRNEDVIAWEHERMKKDGQVHAPWPIKWTYNFLCFSLDLLYKNRPIQRYRLSTFDMFRLLYRPDCQHLSIGAQKVLHI